MTTRSVRILGTSHYLADEVVTSADVDARLNHPPGYIERYSGAAKIRLY